MLKAPGASRLLRFHTFCHHLTVLIVFSVFPLLLPLLRLIRSCDFSIFKAYDLIRIFHSRKVSRHCSVSIEKQHSFHSIAVWKAEKLTIPPDRARQIKTYHLFWHLHAEEKGRALTSSTDPQTQTYRPFWYDFVDRKSRSVHSGAAFSSLRHS